MELIELKQDKSKNITGFMLHMSQEEAISTIKSLATQIAGNNCNANREEVYLADGKYFSITVDEKPGKK